MLLQHLQSLKDGRHQTQAEGLVRLGDYASHFLAFLASSQLFGMSSNSDAEISDYEDEAQGRKRSRPSESDEVHCMASACMLAHYVLL